MNKLRCLKCKADVFVPDLSAEVKKKTSAVARQTGRMQAVLELKNRAKIGLTEGKAIVFHIANEDG